MLPASPDSCLTRVPWPERCLLEDNKHNLNSHRHWHNWKIRPLGSYILTGCFNCSPYILSIFTECSIYTKVVEKWGQVSNSVSEFRQDKNIKSESSLPYLLLHYSAGIPKCRDAKARRNHYQILHLIFCLISQYLHFCSVTMLQVYTITRERIRVIHFRNSMPINNIWSRFLCRSISLDNNQKWKQNSGNDPMVNGIFLVLRCGGLSLKPKTAFIISQGAKDHTVHLI